MPKAISYVRFSSADQALGSSEERQLANYRHWLSQNPAYQESSLSEIDRGKSAFKAKHLEGGLGRLIKAIEDKRIIPDDAIVIEAFDRISREDTSTALNRINSILNAGVKIVTLEDNSVYTKDSLNTSAVYVLLTKIQASHEYSKRLSSRVKSGWKSNENDLRKGLQAKAPNRPIWIDANGEIITDVAKMVKSAIALFEASVGYRAIIIKLKDDYREIAPKSEASLKRWFTNESIAGYWRGVKAFEPLVTLAEFYNLKELVKSRAIYSKPEERYLLSGLLRCGDCGAGYNFRRQMPRVTKSAPEASENFLSKGIIVYGNCSKFLKTGSCVNSLTIPYEAAELVFNKTVAPALVSIASNRAYKLINQAEYAGMVEQRRQADDHYNRASRLFSATGDEEHLDAAVRFKEQRDRLTNAIDEQDERKKLSTQSLRDITIEEYKNGDPYKIEYKKLTQELICSIENNLIDFRTELKAYGYWIKASRDVSALGLLTTSENSDEYRILKRSQKLRGYIIKETHFNLDDGESIETEFLASRRPNNKP